MNKGICISIICALVMAANGADLGTINVESSTITDLGTDAKTEVSTVNIIDEKIITDVNAKNINQLLNTIPGVTADVRSDIVEIHIRGVNQQEFMGENTGVTVVIDGIPVMQDGGKVRGLNVENIESIKVIKGSAGYLYGENATAGAIIITTKKPKSGSGGEVSVEGGSYKYKNIKAKAYKTTDKYAIDLMAGYKYEDGYWDQTQNDKITATGKFSYFIDDMSDVVLGIDITKQYQETTRGSVTGVTEAQTNPTGAGDGDWAWSKDYNMDIYKYNLSYNKDFEDDGNLKITTYYYKDLYNYISSPRDTTGDGNDDAYTRDNDKDIEQYGIKTEYRNSFNSLAYMIGLDLGNKEEKSYRETTTTYSSYSWWTKTTETYYKGESSDDISTERNYALYGELKYEINKKLTTVFNVRYDYSKYEQKSLDHEFDGTVWSNTTTYDDDMYRNITYRAGLTYEVNPTAILYANISTGFRNPSVSQDDDNPDVDTQTSITYESGLRGKIPYGLSYDASIFQIDTKDIIGKIGGTYYWDSDYYDNVGDSRSRGFELSLKSDRNKKVAFNLAYTYLDAYYTSHKPFFVSGVDNDGDGNDDSFDIVGNQLPRTPHHKINLMTYFKPAPKWEIIPSYYWQSSYYADETNFVKMPSYGYANLKVTYKRKVKKGDLEVFARVDNLFDKQYYRTVYLYSDKSGDGQLDAEDASITVDPGRVFYAGFKYKF